MIMDMSVNDTCSQRHARKLGHFAIDVLYGKCRAIKGKCPNKGNYAKIRVIKPKYS